MVTRNGKGPLVCLQYLTLLQDVYFKVSFSSMGSMDVDFGSQRDKLSKPVNITGPWMEWQGENPSIFHARPVFTQVLEEVKNFDAMAAVNRLKGNYHIAHSCEARQEVFATCEIMRH